MDVERSSGADHIAFRSREGLLDPDLIEVLLVRDQGRLRCCDRPQGRAQVPLLDAALIRQAGCAAEDGLQLPDVALERVGEEPACRRRRNADLAEARFGENVCGQRAEVLPSFAQR